MGKQKIITILLVVFVTLSGIFYCASYEKKEEAVFVAEEIATDKTDKTGEAVGENLSQETGQAVEESSDRQKTELSEDMEKSRIYVHVCGQIEHSGVYCLEEGSRITDLIELAGGFTDEAAKDYVNLAQKLSDGQKIYIPALDEVPEDGLPGDGLSSGAERVGQQSKEPQKININMADKDTLMSLTGIGEAKAEAILKYREEHGGFGSIEELKQIEGIKDGVFNKIKDDIEV